MHSRSELRQDWQIGGNDGGSSSSSNSNRLARTLTQTPRKLFSDWNADFSIAPSPSPRPSPLPSPRAATPASANVGTGPAPLQLLPAVVMSRTASEGGLARDLGSDKRGSSRWSWLTRWPRKAAESLRSVHMHSPMPSVGSPAPTPTPRSSTPPQTQQPINPVKDVPFHSTVPAVFPRNASSESLQNSTVGSSTPVPSGSLYRPESTDDGSYFSFAFGPDELQVLHRPTPSLPSKSNSLPSTSNLLSTMPMILNPPPFQADSPTPYSYSYDSRETPLPTSPTPPSLPSRPILVPFLSSSSKASSINSSIRNRGSWRHSFSSDVHSTDYRQSTDAVSTPPATPPNMQYQHFPQPQIYNNTNARDFAGSVSLFSHGAKSVIPSLVGLNTLPRNVTDSLVGGFGNVSPRRTSLLMEEDLERPWMKSLPRDSMGGESSIVAEETETEEEESDREPSIAEAVVEEGEESTHQQLSRQPADWENELRSELADMIRLI
ncbi:UNVERIFIED_CONTAM: hypothetical protein HDU68_007260 [Siphonaria sp. JEL0065]|nr:hypothetical protein HDU68_007260 [Siphonaria sp. JEL0065]